jgi:hypothetical protein
VKVNRLMEEMDLGIDDVRWFLASRQAEKLLLYRDQQHELTRLIWSGALEEELYNMEERFLEQLQREHDQGLRDLVAVRRVLREVAAARMRRYTES